MPPDPIGPARRPFVVVGLAAALLTSAAAGPAAGATCVDGDTVRGALRTLETERSEGWLRTYDGPGNGHDTPRNLGYPTDTLAVSPDGSRTFVTGASWGGDSAQGGSHYDYLTIAYDSATGQELWQARYEGPGVSQDSPWSMTVSPDGSRLFVTGMSVGKLVGTSPDWDIATVAYDAVTGARDWVARYDAAALDEGAAVEVSPDGERVFVAGDSSYDLVALAYDARDGELEWTATYDGGGMDVAHGIGVTDDSVFLAGKSRGDDWDYATLALDARTGERRWVERYDGPGQGDDSVFALALAPDGSSVFVTGQVDVGGQYDYGTVAYDAATGAPRWASAYDGPPTGLMDEAHAIAADGETVYVTGFSSGCQSGYDYLTVAYDATNGTRRWVTRFNGLQSNSSDIAYAVAVSPDDRTVYVTGETPGGLDGFVTSTHYDVGTVAYDAVTGAERWFATYDGPEHFQDGAFALVVSPDGSRVVVHGERFHNGTPGFGDFLTISYAT